MSSEQDITQVLEALFTTQYGLEKKDQETIMRIIGYGRNMTGLSEGEITTLKEAGLIAADDNKLAIEDAFIFRGVILPSFWLKCLMALHNMITFDHEFIESETNETPSK